MKSNRHNSRRGRPPLDKCIYSAADVIVRLDLSISCFHRRIVYVERPKADTRYLALYNAWQRAFDTVTVFNVCVCILFVFFAVSDIDNVIFINKGWDMFNGLWNYFWRIEVYTIRRNLC